MNNDEFLKPRSNIVQLDPTRIRYPVGTVVVSLRHTSACTPGETGVIVGTYQRTEPGKLGARVYCVLFERMGFDELSSEQLFNLVEIVKRKRCRLLRNYTFSGLIQIERDIASGPLRSLFREANTIADAEFGPADG